MPKGTKRKQVESGSSDERVSAPQKKTRRQSQVRRQANIKGKSTSTVETVNAVQAVSARKMQHPRSTLKSISTGTPLTTIPESPEASGSSSLEPSWEPEGEVDGAEEADTVTELAAAAVNMAEKAQKERVEKDLAASLEKHQSTETDLGNYQIYKEALLESRDLSDARERAESAPAEVKEISLANETLEDKLKRLEQQVEDLQQKLAVVREEKAEMEKLVREKMAKETPEAGKGVAK